MLQIISINNELFAQGQCQRVSFNGTPLSRVEGARVVGEVASLKDWQADPGRYAPAYAVVNVVKAGESFVMGGGWLYITAYCNEHGADIAPTARMFDDRDVARNLAESMGGVAV